MARLIGEVFAGRSSPADVAHEPLAAVLLDLWTEVRAVAPDHWMDRAGHAYVAYLKANTGNQRRSLHEMGTRPTYLARRNDGGGMFYATALIELANQVRLPEALSTRPEIVDLSLRLNHGCRG